MEGMAHRILVVAIALSACKGPVQESFTVVGTTPNFGGNLDVGDGVVVAWESGAVTRLDDAGHTRWKARVGHPVNRALVRLGETAALAASDDGVLAALRLSDGADLWRITAKAAPAAAPLTDGKRVVLVTQTGVLQGYDAATGAALWSTPAADVAREVPPAALVGEVLAVARTHAALEAFSLDDGHGLWRLEGHVEAVAAQGGVLLVLLGSGELRAIDASATKLWSVDVASPEPASLGITDKAAWLSTSAGLQSWALETGRPGKSFAVEHALGPPARDEAVVAIALAGRAGCVKLFSADEGRALAERCVDHQLRGAPVLRGPSLLLTPRDGRVLGLRLDRLALEKPR
jgi:outer membrane protein assembly factor BamB